MVGFMIGRCLTLSSRCTVEEICLIESPTRKRKASDDWLNDASAEIKAKKAKINLTCAEDDDDIVIL